MSGWELEFWLFFVQSSTSQIITNYSFSHGRFPRHFWGYCLSGESAPRNTTFQYSCLYNGKFTVTTFKRCFSRCLNCLESPHDFCSQCPLTPEFIVSTELCSFEGDILNLQFALITSETMPTSQRPLNEQESDFQLHYKVPKTYSALGLYIRILLSSWVKWFGKFFSSLGVG